MKLNRVDFKPYDADAKLPNREWFFIQEVFGEKDYYYFLSKDNDDEYEAFKIRCKNITIIEDASKYKHSSEFKNIINDDTDLNKYKNIIKNMAELL